MTLDQLKSTAKNLQAFVSAEMLKVKAVHGFNISSFKAASAIIHDVIEIIDQTKLQFADITNEQMQTLAVDAVYEVIDMLLKSQLGMPGKIIYALLPNSLKRNLCKMIVDLIVNAIHRTKDKVVASFKK